MTDEEDDDTSFAFIAGLHGEMQLGKVWGTFGEPELTPPERRARFHDAIAALKDSLDSYEPLASVFDLDDDRLIEASTAVHRALRDVQVEHVHVTGGQFPRSRDELAAHRRPHESEVEPPHGDEDFEPVPPLEFASVVPLDIPLESVRGAHRVRAGLAYSTGVMLTIEGILLRNGEPWSTWRESYQAFMRPDRDHVPLVVHGHAADTRGGHASGGTRLAQREQEYWIPGPFLADTLECEYRLSDDERVTFTLDARVLREAQSRARPI